jgi:hypothetical protein
MLARHTGSKSNSLFFENNLPDIFQCRVCLLYLHIQTNTHHTMANKAVTKEKMMELLKGKFNVGHIRDASDFSGRESSGIWMSAEGSNFVDKTCVWPMFDYYSKSQAYKFMGVYSKVHHFLEEHGWHAEWNDPGTMMLYPS